MRLILPGGPFLWIYHTPVEMPVIGFEEFVAFFLINFTNSCTIYKFGVMRR
jgi:hypothetical protein